MASFQSGLKLSVEFHKAQWQWKVVKMVQ